MPETYPLSLPASNIATMTWRPRHAVAFAESPFSFRGDVQLHDGDGWAVDCTLPPMERATAEAWIAWRLRLKGMYGTFLMSPVGATTPLGTLAGTPLANSAGSPSVNLAGDDTLYIKGWTNGATIKAGDWLQVGSSSTARLHKNLTDVTIGGTGQGIHRIFPTLRETLADNAAITKTSPVGLFRMSGNEAAWDVGEAQIYGLSFTAIEALP
jgi:hypothetical protein